MSLKMKAEERIVIGINDTELLSRIIQSNLESETKGKRSYSTDKDWER